MEISEEEQSYTDFDWFCTDKSGCIGHFASAGFKRIPRSVAGSAEDLTLLTKFFEGLPAKKGWHILDSQLAPERRTGAQTRDFVEIANRGLFSFDIESYLSPGISYFRVALPLTPLRVEDLPEVIRHVLSKTMMVDRLFVNSPHIPYAETVEI